MMAHYPLEVDQPYGMRHWDWFDDYGYQGAAEENGDTVTIQTSV